MQQLQVVIPYVFGCIPLSYVGQTQNVVDKTFKTLLTHASIITSNLNMNIHFPYGQKTHTFLHTSTSFITLGSNIDIWTFPQNSADLETCV